MQFTPIPPSICNSRRIGEELGRTLGKAQTGIRYDQPHAINIKVQKSSQNGSKPVTKSDPVSEVS
jgi:hypothetical protein